MTNIDTTDNIQINGTEIEKVTNYKYLGQTIAMKNRTKTRSFNQNKSRMECFLKVQRNVPRQSPSYEFKKKGFNQCVLPAITYGCQTWSLTKALVKKLETSQPAMERRMLNVKLEDRIRNTTFRQRTRVTEIVQYVTNTKWKWAGHIARTKDNRWNIRSSEWQTESVRSAGRPKRCWRYDCGATRSGMDEDSK